MSQRASFDDAPLAGHINFGVGQPSADLLPVHLLRQAAEQFLHHGEPVELNYGEKPGDIRFRESLAGLLSGFYPSPVQADSLFVTAGASQALGFICSLFTRPGDTVFVEEPSYFLAFNIFRESGLNIVTIPMDRDGMDIEALEAALRQTRPAFVYTIPVHHNPGGQCLPDDRRERLLELSQKYGFLIVADEVYQLLSYGEPPPAPFGSYVEQTLGSQVLSLGSFSKILAPGMRLGWIQASPALIRKMTGSGLIRSGGSLNHFTSLVVRSAIDLDLQQAHIRVLQKELGLRLAAMDQALQQHLGDSAQWRKPKGGYFFWLEFEPGFDSRAAQEQAARFGTGFQPGVLFAANGGLDHCMRLSFAHYNENQIKEGAARLAALLSDCAIP